MHKKSDQKFSKNENNVGVAGGRRSSNHAGLTGGAVGGAGVGTSLDLGENRGLTGRSLISNDIERERVLKTLSESISDKVEKQIKTITRFSVPFPVSVNAVWMPLYGRMVLRPEARQYRDKLLAAFKRDGLPVKFEKSDRLAVHYVLFEPDASRDRDVANYEKLLTDVLQKAGIIPNDHQIDDNRQTRGGVDADRPRVEVFIARIAN